MGPVNLVDRSLPLVQLHQQFRVQIPQASEAEPAEHPGDGGEGSPEQPDDVVEMKVLVSQLHGVLQLLRIERPQLSAANSASSR